MSLFRRKDEKPSEYIPTVERSRVVVHTTGGDSLAGVLTHVYPDCIVLEHATALSTSGNVPIDGEAIIERSRVKWLQRLGASATEEA